MTPRTTRWIHTVHTWTGLLIGINVLIFSITAAWLLVDEMVHQYTDHVAETENVPLDATRRLPIQPTIDRLEQHFAAVEGVVGRVAPAHFQGDLDRILVVAGKNNFLIYDREPYTGALTLTRGALPEGITPVEGSTASGAVGAEAASLGARISQFMLQLHESLLLETWGTFLVGTLGLIFLVSTITGWIIYSPFMKSMAFGVIRREKALHMRMADMHKLVGIAALAFNLLMAVTGLGLTFGVFGIQYQVMVDLKKNESEMGSFVKADPLPSFESVWATAQALYPDQFITRIDFPVEGAIQGTRVYSSFAEPNPRDPGLLPSIGIITAEATPRAHPYPLVWWMKAILVGGRLHTGAMGGNLVLLSYLFLSASSGFLSISGYMMYVSKWRKKRRTSSAQENVPADDSEDEQAVPETAAAYVTDQG